MLIRIARGELLAATEVYRRRLRVVLGPGRAFLVPTEDAVAGPGGMQAARSTAYPEPRCGFAHLIVNTQIQCSNQIRKKKT